MFTKVPRCFGPIVLLAVGFSAVSAHAWPVAYGYRQPLSITNNGMSTLDDYPIRVTLDTSGLIAAGKMRQNCADLLFTDSSDVPLSHWLSTGCNTPSTSIWVRVPTIPKGTALFFMYYGNPNATLTNNQARVCPGNGDVTSCFDLRESFENPGMNGTLPGWVHTPTRYDDDLMSMGCMPLPTVTSSWGTLCSGGTKYDGTNALTNHTGAGPGRTGGGESSIALDVGMTGRMLSWAWAIYGYDASYFQGWVKVSFSDGRAVYYVAPDSQAPGNYTGASCGISPLVPYPCLPGSCHVFRNVQLNGANGSACPSWATVTKDLTADYVQAFSNLTSSVRVTELRVGLVDDDSRGNMTAGLPQSYNQIRFDLLTLTPSAAVSPQSTLGAEQLGLPVTPDNVAPVDGATVFTLTPQLTTTPFSDPQGDPQRFVHFQVRTQSGVYGGPDGFEMSTTTLSPINSWTTPTLVPGVTYFWHARHGEHVAGISPFSNETSFTVDPMLRPLDSGFPMDGGASFDGGISPDGGPTLIDAGNLASDAGIIAGGGRSAEDLVIDHGGCGCGVGGEWPLWWAAILVALEARRRHRSKREEKK